MCNFCEDSENYVVDCCCCRNLLIFMLNTDHCYSRKFLEDDNGDVLLESVDNPDVPGSFGMNLHAIFRIIVDLSVHSN